MDKLQELEDLRDHLRGKLNTLNIEAELNGDHTGLLRKEWMGIAVNLKSVIDEIERYSPPEFELMENGTVYDLLIAKRDWLKHKIQTLDDEMERPPVFGSVITDSARYFRQRNELVTQLDSVIDSLKKYKVEPIVKGSEYESEEVLDLMSWLSE